MIDLWAFGTLFIATLGLGLAILSLLGTPHDDSLEFAALATAAGLGASGVLLGVLGLVGSLHAARFWIPVGALGTLGWIVARIRSWPRPSLRRPTPGTALLIVMIAAAAIGSIAPTTDDDSLTYPIPIAQHLVRDGQWRFWPDQALSTYPLSQELLEAALLDAGATRLGPLSGLEFALTAFMLMSLARRVAREQAAIWLAPVIALGCPAAAFLASSAKEDMLLIMMTVAAALALYLRPSMGAAITAGLFAGFAAGAKYPGAPVPIAVLICAPLCCGRNGRFTSLIATGTTALAAGGLWYFVNLARFSNPVAPFLPDLGHPPMAASAVQEWLSRPEYGRAPLDAILNPLRVAFGPADVWRRKLDPDWINPLGLLGLLGVFGAMRDRRRIGLPLLVIALAIYAVWFMGTQVGRLLLPAAALLSVHAADILIRVWRRFSLTRYPIGIVVALSAGIVLAVGLIRAERYFADPDRFMEYETMHYADIDWMNKHLDPSHDRVATLFRTCAYLKIPWMNLSAAYQAEISPEEIADPRRLYEALKRQGFTHLFGKPDDFNELDGALKLIRANPASRLGGTRFFREPPAEVTAIFEIK